MCHRVKLQLMFSGSRRRVTKELGFSDAPRMFTTLLGGLQRNICLNINIDI